MDYDVYISYADEDRNIADAICSRLESEDIRCWYLARDYWAQDPGTAWDVQLKKARLLVLVFTDHANVSGQVSNELKDAVNLGIPVIPFKRTGGDPEGEMMYYLSTLHWLNVVDCSLEHAMEQLAGRCRSMLDAIAKGAPEDAYDTGRTGRQTRLFGKKLLRRRIYLLAGFIAVLAVVVVSVRLFLKNGDGELPLSDAYGTDGGKEKASANDSGLTAAEGGYEYAVMEDGTAELTGYLKDNERTVEIPGEIGGYRVTRIGWHCFDYHSEIQKVVLPASVEELGTSAFLYCENLSSINFPAGLRKIESGCFSYCGLVNVVIPDSLEVLEDYVFSNNSYLETVVIGSGIASLEQGTFTNCGRLMSISIPSTVGYIGGSCFQGTEQAVVTGGPGTAAEVYCSIKGMTFVADSSLGVGDMSPVPADGSDIPASALFLTSRHYRSYNGEDRLSVYIDGCVPMTDLVIPDTIDGLPVTGITSMAFQNMTGLETVRLPDSIEVIENMAFKGCTALREINIPAGIRKIGNAAFYRTGIIEVTLPAGLTELQDYVFCHCDSLKRAVIEEGLTEIQDSTFDSCDALEELYIPASVKKIHNDALEDDSHVVIFGAGGSAAEQYAGIKGFEFRAAE